MSGRLHHLDALRALTMVLILPAHALAIVGLRGGWNDTESALYWTIHVFRLPLFFLVAGFFAALLIEARGVSALLRNRAIRIGVPLLVGVVAVVPLITLEVQALSEQPHRPQVEGIGAFADLHPSFLWFLWYLTLIYAAALLVRRLLAASPKVRLWLLTAGRRLLALPAAPLLLAVPTALLLYRQPTWLAAAPSESFAPQFDLLGYYAIFFAAGWTLFAAPELRAKIELHPRRYLRQAAIALPLALALYLLQKDPALGANRGVHLLALGLLSVATWTLVFGLLGVAHRFGARPNPTLRYWTDAAYWIYLSHFPVMAAIALAIAALPMPEGLRLAVLSIATLAVIFPAYGAFVRHTAIGRVLHGPRSRTPQLVPGLPLTRPAAAAEPRA
ncbi:MAG TPA: acyltransferase family protein [Solirubrobacterales bacterium]|nr:acyltransferase family protein [Solirubrobacterales bacterium]